MMINDITLNEVLERLNSPPTDVIALPIAHLTSARSFGEIIKDVAFKPTRCPVFEHDLLYFSYGGVFHRYGQEPTSEATKLPVAFVFKSTLLRKIDYLFPYDTGAAKKGLYNNEDLCNFDKYRVLNSGGYELPPKLVYYLYGSNKQYLLGEVVQEFHQQNNLLMKNLLEFLQSNLCELGVDYRQRVIECQSTKQISLADILEDILWVGLPKLQLENLWLMCEIKQGEPPHVVERYTYEYNNARRPSEIASILENKAKEVIINRWLDYRQ